MKHLLLASLLTFSCNATAEWIEYSTKPNGDVFYFDSARVETSGNQMTVWTRVRYKTSVMAASSYQSLVRLDCSEKSETVWSKPAMATNTNPQPKKSVKPESPTGLLINLLCKAS